MLISWRHMGVFSSWGRIAAAQCPWRGSLRRPSRRLRNTAAGPAHPLPDRRTPTRTDSILIKVEFVQLSYVVKKSWQITYRDKDLSLRRSSYCPPAICGTPAAHSLLFGVAQTWQGQRLFLRQPRVACGRGAVWGFAAFGAFSGYL